MVSPNPHSFHDRTFLDPTLQLGKLRKLNQEFRHLGDLLPIQLLTGDLLSISYVLGTGLRTKLETLTGVCELLCYLDAPVYQVWFSRSSCSDEIRHRIGSLGSNFHAGK